MQQGGEVMNATQAVGELSNILGEENVKLAIKQVCASGAAFCGANFDNHFGGEDEGESSLEPSDEFGHGHSSHGHHAHIHHYHHGSHTHHPEGESSALSTLKLLIPLVLDSLFYSNENPKKIVNKEE